MAASRSGVRTITIQGITKRYGQHRALAPTDLTLTAGRVCALLGPNGAGKSTLLGILSTLVRPSSGTVQFFCDDGTTLTGSELRRRIGVLAHESFVYGELTGCENMTFYANLYGLKRVNQRAAEVLDQVGLDPKAAARPARTYSRGMTQRLALARTLLHQPDILLLDEPFTGLDHEGSLRLREVLSLAQRHQNIV